MINMTPLEAKLFNLDHFDFSNKKIEHMFIEFKSFVQCAAQRIGVAT